MQAQKDPVERLLTEGVVVLHASLSALVLVCVAWVTHPSPLQAKIADDFQRSMIRVDDDPPADLSRKGDGPSGEVVTHVFEHTFFNQHTKEVLAVGPSSMPASMSERFATFLRCRITGHQRTMARVPIEVALQMADRFDKDRIVVISGFRSPKFNEQLRKKGRQVARASHHTKAEALDFRLEGVSAKELAAAVGEVHQGGIGTYRKSDFVHVDVGRPRSWNGK